QRQSPQRARYQWRIVSHGGWSKSLSRRRESVWRSSRKPQPKNPRIRRRARWKLLTLKRRKERRKRRTIVNPSRTFLRIVRTRNVTVQTRCPSNSRNRQANLSFSCYSVLVPRRLVLGD